MRKFSFLFFSILFITACSDNTGSKSTDTKQSTEADKSAAPSAQEDAEADKAVALIAKNGCLACHKVDEPFTGPAYTAVAAKYENTEAVVDTLVQKVIKGGSGNWGTVPMIAHPGISIEDAKTIVHYILSLKK